jgi:hypothetical protein
MSEVAIIQCNTLLTVLAETTSHKKTNLSPPQLTNRALSSLTAISRTSYPCPVYVCTRPAPGGSVLALLLLASLVMEEERLVESEVEEEAGLMRARAGLKRRICRSVEPVRIYWAEAAE